MQVFSCEYCYNTYFEEQLIVLYGDLHELSPHLYLIIGGGWCQVNYLNVLIGSFSSDDEILLGVVFPCGCKMILLPLRMCVEK